MSQLSLFAVAEERETEGHQTINQPSQSTPQTQPTHSEKGQEKAVQEVRSSAQTTRKIAYDVGEEIGGSKKHLAALRQQFEECHDSKTLSELEETDRASAVELIRKDELFKSFSLEQEKENGVEPHVARFKQLIIRRIDKHPQDSQEHREAYLNAARNLLDIINFVKEDSQLKDMIHGLNKMIYREVVGKRRHEELESKIEFGQESLLSLNWQDRLYQETVKEIQAARVQLAEYKEAMEKQYSALGQSFYKLFTSNQSLNSTIRTANKAKSWDDLLNNNTKKKKQGTKRKKWTRDLPERPDRQGGVEVNVSTPEDMVTTFGFKGVQFGHYVSDQKGKEHIIRSSEALMDLSDVLDVDPNFFSLENTLALAFGARGSGNALGHYENLYKVINFTKSKGTLGILAHEWFHALDNFIGTKGTQKTKTYLSDEACMSYDWIPLEVKQHMKKLLSVIKEGESKVILTNENTDSRGWRAGFSTKKLYERHLNSTTLALDVDGLSKEAYQQEEERLNRHLSFNVYLSEGEKTKLRKKYERNYKKTLQCILWLHEEKTGERLETIPMYVSRSPFYQQSINLDGDKKGKYFSSDREMVARCFEAYIQDQLESLDRRNDYLVAGTKDAMAYPKDEQRQQINDAVQSLIESIKSNYIQ